MLSHVRYAVAYIAARVISEEQSTSIYDCWQQRRMTISGAVENGQIRIYDAERGTHISGSYSSFYHEGERSQISLTVNGNHFSGYDYGSSTHFSGNVNDRSVSLYDQAEGRFFNYVF